MEQLIALVCAKTGISAEQARSSIDTVLHFLKDKLPAPLASQLDAAVNSGGAGGTNLADMAKNVPGLGGLFGSK